MELESGAQMSVERVEWTQARVDKQIRRGEKLVRYLIIK